MFTVSMPTQTRSQARSAQTADLVTSPRAHLTPRRILRSRQGNAGVVMSLGDGGPSFIAAVGTRSSSGYTFTSCNDRRCMTCPNFIKLTTFKSNVTNIQCKVISHTGERLSCHSQNIIYLLTCKGCGIQYVGETVEPFHKRNNQHRTQMSIHFQFHCETSCQYGFTYQIIEKLPGTGYKNGRVDEDLSKIRKAKEDVWIKKMRVIFPYGLNEKAKCKVSDSSKINEVVGRLYKEFPIPRSGVRPTRSRLNRNQKKYFVSCDDFFNTLEDLFANYLYNSFCKIRILLDKTKKKVLKEIAFHILERESYTFHPNSERWYLYTLDIIDTKLYKEPPIIETKSAPENICVVPFVNKGIEQKYRNYEFA